MSSNLRDIRLEQIMPPNLLRDEKVKNLATVLSAELQLISELSDKLNFSDIDNLPEPIIDYLLWESHITPNEGLDLAQTLEEKRELVKNAIDLHRHKGTRYAVERVLSLLNIRAIVEEWFEYDGDPYHFRIKLLELTTRGVSEEQITLLEKLVNEFKNERSWLEAINIYLTSYGTMCFSTVIQSGEEITVYPWQPNAIETVGTASLGSATQSIETVTVYPQ